MYVLSANALTDALMGGSDCLQILYRYPGVPAHIQRNGTFLRLRRIPRIALPTAAYATLPAEVNVATVQPQSVLIAFPYTLTAQS